LSRRRWRCGRPLPAARRRFASAGLEKRDQVVNFTRFENFSEGRHAVASPNDLSLDRVGGVVLADGPEIGRTISANSSDAVAAFAARSLEDGGPMLARIWTSGLRRAVMDEQEDCDRTEKDDGRNSQSRGREDGHVLIILSKAVEFFLFLRVCLLLCPLSPRGEEGNVNAVRMGTISSAGERDTERI
jgi:hypothetical protein